MAQNKIIKSAEFDSIVIGGGLSGLIAAFQLESSGRKVALLEGLDTLGGSCRPSQSLAGTLDHSLKFFPDSPETIDALNWLSSVLGEQITWECVEAPPVNYDDGKFKPFIGFGDQKIQTASEVAAYGQARYLKLNRTPKDWIRILSESFTGTIVTQSNVTKMMVDDSFVIELIVNGSKRYSGREILFCAAPQQLPLLLSEASIPTRIRQRLAKGDFWTSVNLDLIHNSIISDSRAVHVLKGANEEPSVGLFHAPSPLADQSLGQVSQWMTLVHRDITEDAEAVASALKQIKRQVKRAYETSMDHVIQERIAVIPTSHGDLSGVFNDDGRWPKIDNLWVISSFLNSQRNVVGAIRQARTTLHSIMGESYQAIESDSDLSLSSAIPTA
jgi:hypothetical protein